MAAIIAVLLTLCTPRSTSRSSSLGAAGVPARAGNATVRMLVLDFDPVVPHSASRPAHRAFGWSDPHDLVAIMGFNYERGDGKLWWAYVTRFDSLISRGQSP